MARLSLIVDPSGAEQGYRRARQAGERYKATARDTADRTDRVRGSFRRLTDAAFSLQGALAGIGVGLAIQQTIRRFSEFERQLVEVGKTTDLQGAQLQQLGERIQVIGQEVPLATERLLSLATAAGQLGVTGVDNISRFAETLGQLEVATDIAGEQGARSLARLLNITGQGVDQIDRLGAAITALGNNFATTEGEITQTATFLAASTQQFDLTAQQVLGLSAALRSLGQRAETSGSAVGAALSEINTALADGGEELQTLTTLTGQTVDQLRQTFAEDATEVLTDFAEALGDLPAAAQTRVLEDFNLAGRETRRVIGALAADTDMVRAALQTANEEWDRNEALNIEAARAAETFSAQMTFLGNAINQAAVDIGRELAPVILDITRDIRDFVQEASDTGRLERIFRDVASALQVLVDNMDALIVAGGALIGLRLGAAFGPWGALIGAAAGAMTALATATSDTTDAASQLEDAQRSLNSVIDEGANASDRAAKAAREQALAALDAAEAEIQSIQRIQQARESVGAGTGAVNPEGSTIFSRQISALQSERERIQGQLGRLEAQQIVEDATTVFRGSRPQAGGAGGGSGGLGGVGGSSTDDDDDGLSLVARQSQGYTDLFRRQQIRDEQALAVSTQLLDTQAEARQAIEDRMQAMREHQQVLDARIAGEEDLARALEIRNGLSEEGRQAFDANREQIMSLIESERQLTDEIERQANAQQFLEDAGTRAFDRIGSSITEAFVQGESAAISFESVAQGVISELLQSFIQLATINPLKNALFGTNAATLNDLGGIFGSVFGGGGGFQGVGAAVPVGARADGGPVSGGRPYLVGERGPELFTPSANGNITPNNRMGSVTNVYVENNTGEEVRTERTPNGNGGDDVRVMIGKEFSRQLASGNFDKPMRSRFGITPQPGTR